MANIWTNRTTKELSKAVRNFNNKIKRLEKSERDLILPKKASVSEIKKEINNRWELNRKIKELERYSKRGIEETITTKGGVRLSQYEYENIQKEQKRLYDKLGRTIKRIENITPKNFGIPEDVTYKQMGTQQLANLKARRQSIGRRNIDNLDMETLKKLVNLLNITKAKEKYQSEVFRNNYMDKMLFGLGYYSGYDNEKMNYIREKMNTLTDTQFMKAFENDLALQALRDYYPAIHKEPGARTMYRINSMFDELYNNIDDIVAQYKK